MLNLIFLLEMSQAQNVSDDSSKMILLKEKKIYIIIN